MTSTVTSADGTVIAFEATGNGPPLILVDGAMCHRDFGPARPLATKLHDAFTVYTYDRRGRGESGDTAPYAVDREIEDLRALIEHAGGEAFVYGISSGAALAVEAAARIPGITRLAVYEAPYLVDESGPAEPEDYHERMRSAIADGRPGDAVKQFMRLVGTPRLFIAILPLTPAWSKLKRVGHTLPYDHAILAPGRLRAPLPAERWTSVTMPALVMNGGKSPDWMRHAALGLAEALPNAEHRTLEGQTHMLKPEAVAGVLTEFFTR